MRGGMAVDHVAADNSALGNGLGGIDLPTHVPGSIVEGNVIAQHGERRRPRRRYQHKPRGDS